MLQNGEKHATFKVLVNISNLIFNLAAYAMICLPFYMGDNFSHCMYDEAMFKQGFCFSFTQVLVFQACQVASKCHVNQADDHCSRSSCGTKCYIRLIPKIKLLLSSVNRQRENRMGYVIGCKAVGVQHIKGMK